MSSCSIRGRQTPRDHALSPHGRIGPNRVVRQRGSLRSLHGALILLAWGQTHQEKPRLAEAPPSAQRVEASPEELASDKRMHARLAEIAKAVEDENLFLATKPVRDLEQEL